MKSIVKKAIRDEKGAALALTLVLLLVGGLIIAPLLGFIGTGTIAGGVHEKRMDELYAADAGVEDAIWKIQKDPDVKVPACGNDPRFWSYNISDINGNDVEFDITYVEGPAFVVESRTKGQDSQTQIVAHIIDKWADYSKITDHILASRESDLDDIHDNVRLIYDDDNGPYPQYPGPWPTANDIIEFYKKDVEGLPSYPLDTLDASLINGPVGPLYRIGDLDILNYGNQQATLTLHDTIYITEFAEVGTKGKAGKPNLTIELAGNTIFVGSNSTGHGKEALIISDWVTIKGPGVIIAIGDIYFAPNGDVGDPESPVFIMSVTGTTRIRPGITICGAVAGNVDVTIQSGDNPTITYPPGGFPEDLNFPGFLHDNHKWAIASWTLN